jgi:organic anion transporter 3A
MYAHQPPMGAYRSIEYGFNSLSQAEGMDSSLSRSNSRGRRKSREEKADLINNDVVLMSSHEKSLQGKSLHERMDGETTCSSDDFNQVEGTECGILSFRPFCLQNFATIQVFVFLSCILVTLNQALSSGYFNSVITTIEKRFDIPSRMTGLIASTFEIGNLITVIFVSYFGTHRHIPKWIAKGVVVTGIGSLVFSLAHFTGQDSNPLDKVNSSGPFDDNICHIPSASLNSPFVERR